MLRFLFSTFFSTFFLVAHADGIVDCLGTELDWYKTKVGETPCTTYERLRKICNPSCSPNGYHAYQRTSRYLHGRIWRLLLQLCGLCSEHVLSRLSTRKGHQYNWRRKSTHYQRSNK
ncbi:hypothetical protein C8R42DRAFT_673397 [Lentinula raphanica]|nr:hypothetical protein C8R42DRAFT_673397 [Lentinula raphanica]